MKRIAMLSVVALVISGWITSYGQATESEVPGDNFSLEGALELFKKSASPEEFEKLLNSPDSKVNNLDLNGDGYIDYIRVLDRYEGNVHAFIIQAVVSESEYQDVAVIELEKLANGKAVLQIIGDEDVYGVETIIEPTREVRTYAGTTSNRTVVNVWTWPSVQYVYSPYYAGWMSPWGWYHRPVWWRAWRPVAYVHYFPIWRPYYSYYSVCHTHRVSYAHRIYRPHRVTSVVVYNRHRSQIDRYRSSARNDSNRNRSGRSDEGRSYSRDDHTTASGSRSRENVDLNRRSLPQRESVPAENRSGSRERSVTTDAQRSTSGMKGQEIPERRSGDVDNGREVRQQPATPEIRSRSSESPATQRSPVRERTVPTDVQRNTPEIKRQEVPTRSSSTIQNNREVRPSTPSVNRSRSEAPKVQQQPSVPRSTPSVQQTPRSSGSPGVQQRSAPRSSGSPDVQQKSGGGRSSEGRRGRQ